MQILERNIWLEYLDGYAAIETEMLRVIDHAHSADADQGFEVVLFNNSTTYKVIGVTKREQFSISQTETLRLLVRVLALRTIFCQHDRLCVFNFSKIGH